VFTIRARNCSIYKGGKFMKITQSLQILPSIREILEGINPNVSSYWDKKISQGIIPTEWEACFKVCGVKVMKSSKNFIILALVQASPWRGSYR